MNKIFLMLLSSISFTTVFSQTAEDYYNQAMEKASANKFDEMIVLLNKSIALDSTEYIAWYNRGIAKTMLDNYEDALPDFERTIKLYPEWKKGYLNRGTSKKHLGDYTGAISDYNYALELDPNYSDAFYNRGLVYEILDKKDSACIDFNNAKKNGEKNAQRKIDNYNDTTKHGANYHTILRLTKTTDDNSYGFTQANPIKVGSGPDGGPANQQDYLNLLRDKQGKPITYSRIGSCCMYESPNGFGGYGLLDKYQITYKNEKGKEENAIIYLTFYDYDELKILAGFKTIGQK